MARPSSASTPTQRGGEGAPTRVDDEGDTQRREGDNAHMQGRGECSFTERKKLLIHKGREWFVKHNGHACGVLLHRGEGMGAPTQRGGGGCLYTEGWGWVLVQGGEGSMGAPTRGEQKGAHARVGGGIFL